MKNAEKSELLYLASDIFSYPKGDWIKKLEKFAALAGAKLEYSGSLAEIEATYIHYFEHNSSKFGIVPIASYWIDGRLGGDSSREIERFYEACGLKFEDFGHCDHISKMFAFAAWLLENDEEFKFESFKTRFSWLDKFDSNLNKIPQLRPFREVLVICSKLLKSNVKEK